MGLAWTNVGMVVAGLATSGVWVAAAQESDSLSVDAGITVGETYTDNVFRTANRKRDDVLTTIAPSIGLSTQGPRADLAVSASAEIGRYADNTSENYEDVSVRGEGRVRLTEQLFLFGGGDHAWDHEDRSSPDDVNGTQPTEFREASGFAGVSGQFGATSMRLGVNLRDFDFDDTPAASGLAINNDDRDRTQTEFGGRVGRLVGPGRELFGQGVIDQRRYDSRIDDSGFERDSQGYQAAIGVKDDAGTLRGEVLVGLISQDFEDSRFERVTVLDVGADLTWRPASRTRVTGIVERQLRETTTVGASSYLSTTAGVRVSHLVAPEISAHAHLFATEHDFQGVDRKDYITEAGFGLRRYLSPNVFIGADYDHTQRLSNVAGVDYDDHSATLRMGADLDPAFPDELSGTGPTALHGLYVGGQVSDGALQTKLDGPRGNGGSLTADFGELGPGGGVLAGYRADFDGFVIGLEADADLSEREWVHNANRTFSVDRQNALGLSALAGRKVAGDTLLYGRFGITGAQFESRYARGGDLTVREETEVGLNGGVGAEFPIGGGFSARLEYLIAAYPDYDIGAPSGVNEDNFSNTETIARLGLLYHFGAKPREQRARADFGGFYAGAQGGHGTMRSANTGARPNAAAPAFTLDATRSGQGVTGGVFAGYGFQSGAFYAGVEAEAELSTADWNIERDPTGRIISTEKAGTIGTLARAGYVISDAVLVYGRAGVVGSHFDTSYTVSGTTIEQDDLLAGLRYGGGVEVVLTERLNLRLDYTRTDYEDQAVSTSAGVDRFDTTENMFRAGLVYGF